MARILVLAVAIVVLADCSGRSTAAAEPRPAATATGFFPSGDARLNYQLDLPARTGPVPAVVFGHGSGRLNKTSCRFLAEAFLQRGFATLCFDKRGVGESSGEYVNVGTRDSVPVFETLAGDMAAGVGLLRAHADIDGERIGLAGVSQAGWIIPLAARQTRPAFFIILSGPTVSVGEEIFYSRLVEFTSTPLEEAFERLPSFTGERGFDPRPVLESLDVPGLWLLGAADRSIPTPATAAILDRLSKQGRPFTNVVFAGFGHDLSGAAIWPQIDTWLARVLRRPGQR